MPAANTPRPSPSAALEQRRQRQHRGYHRQLCSTGVNAGSAKRWWLFKIAPASEVSEMKTVGEGDPRMWRAGRTWPVVQRAASEQRGDQGSGQDADRGHHEHHGTERAGHVVDQSFRAAASPDCLTWV